MTSTIDRIAYRAARCEGMSPGTAAYAARPARFDLDFTWTSDSDHENTTVTVEGDTYRVTIADPRDMEGSCDACDEMVDAYRRQDEDYAWMSPDEYDNSDHVTLSVELLDADGDGTGWSAALGGVCGSTATPTLRRLHERYLAETAEELIGQVRYDYAAALAQAATRRAVKLAEARGHYMSAVAACA